MCKEWKKIEVWSEIEERSFGCVDHGQGESSAPGNRGVEQTEPGNSRVQSETQDQPSTQPGGPRPIQLANQLTRQPINHAIPIPDQEPNYQISLICFHYFHNVN